jgi:hypothetical protein
MLPLETSWGTDAGADFFNGSKDDRDKFWRCWSLVTGVEVADEVREKIAFRCAC